MPYPRRLEQALRGANPGRDVEVVALAVPGYSSHQGLLLARAAIFARLQPDLVTLCFGWNDIDRRTGTDRQGMPGGSLHVGARRLVARSQALMHAGLWLREQRSRSAAGRPAARVMRVPRAEFVENMLGMARLAREAGAEVALMAPVYGNPIAHPPEGDDIAGHREALRAAAAAAGIPFLEVPELTEQAHPRERAAVRGAHPPQPPRPSPPGRAPRPFPGRPRAAARPRPPRRKGQGRDEPSRAANVALAALFVAGALHWLAFFGTGAETMSFTAADWPKEFRYYSAVKQAVTEGRVPYYVSRPIHERASCWHFRS